MKKRSRFSRSTQASAIYRGPYIDAAPDLIVGYARGYRTSWEAAVGKVTARVFEDNVKAWSGDHCVDPALVPGVLFSNLKVDAEDPGIEDMAPTALSLFGIEAPLWMEGKAGCSACPVPLSVLVVDGCWILSAMLAFAPRRTGNAGDCDRRRWHGPGVCRTPLGRSAESRASARSGKLRAAGDDDSAAEPGGMVDVHHGARSGAAWNFRFRSSRSADAGTVSIDGRNAPRRDSRFRWDPTNCR